uniref:Uncharacterized protein n=1 Tax=Oryza sativa subsp. japonica TaxID=39947 RepID=Q6K6U3_ORYSJ|nr:hypothetical protein [Oryza sativa Japonica Group]BAD21953.1 hypothetical protein [Oryza sativa Japonica Group]
MAARWYVVDTGEQRGVSGGMEATGMEESGGPAGWEDLATVSLGKGEVMEEASQGASSASLMPPGQLVRPSGGEEGGADF